jgi:acyl carrier protein
MDTNTFYTTEKMSDQQIFSLLKQFIAEIIGEDFAALLDITPATTFSKNLEMDSIELVAFSEKVRRSFGDRIDFTGWLSGMDIDQMIALTIGDIIQYIQQCRS